MTDKHDCDCGCLEEENIIVLVDEEGAEHEFQIIDTIEVDGERYAILLPTDEEDDEAIILKVGTDEQGNEVYYEIEDDEEWEKVADAWQEMIEEEEV
ncbi:MAG: DUF1292 domain-containing protein [Firmicutes bacterium]|nr:DUF1292 domain-containing protein [Bacillota bacterium]